MSGFIAKQYQQSVLDSVVAYFRECNVLGNPAEAFTAVTRALWGKGLGYHRIDGFADDMPYACLRVPTGGGKTWLGAKCVPLVNSHLLRTERSVVLWLVPSKAIRDQTLKQLRDRGGALHAALSGAGAITVLDLDEAKSVTRGTLDTSTVVIVSTVQAFNRENTEGLKVHQSSGALMQHFSGVEPVRRARLLHDADGALIHSLANVLRMRRPFLIVDEAHNNRTDLAFSTLAAFDPAGILELTATPATADTPSNVLHSVSAAELKAEQMIKLPILLETESDWQKCIAYGLDRREQLQAAADREQREGAPPLRPLVLVQAQPRSKDRDTLHWERVLAELIENQGVPETHIAVATGERNDLPDIDARYRGGISDEACPIRFVVTQQALSEGWDCPSAYVLVSLAATHSETVAEQLLGRILRQPGAVIRDTQALNQSYACVMSSDFTATANALRDRLVEGAGFERKAAEAFVRAERQEQAGLDLASGRGRVVVTPVVVPLAGKPPLRQLPKPLQQKVSWDPGTRHLTILQPLTQEEAATLSATAADAGGRDAIVQAGLASRTTALQIRTSPSERGESLVVPAMAIRAQGELQLFDDPEVLDYPFDLSVYDAFPTLEERHALDATDRVSSGGAIDVTDDGRMKVGFIANLQRDLGFTYRPEHWDEVKLTAWLCRNLPDAGVTHASKWAFVQKWMRTLLDTASDGLARANRQKFLIRSLLEARIRDLRRTAVRSAFQQVLFGQDRGHRVSVGGAFGIAFDPNAYAPAADYDDRYGLVDFRHHYYARIGDFDSREEFECACRLDQLAAEGRLRFWVRNLVNRTGASFFLQKADGRFYPDFICVLPDDRVLVVEYKGGMGWTDAQDDRDIGALWAEMSDGACMFVMVRDRQWHVIDAIAR